MSEGLGVFYERHVHAVAAFVGGRVRRPEVVFDLVAETFARALERRDQFDRDRVKTVRPVPGVQGAAFLSCVDTESYLHGWPLTAAVLLKAGRPGDPVAAIPDTQPVAGDPGIVTGLRSAITARRLGNAWLIVKGGRDQAQRVQVLKALRTTRR